MYWVKRQSLRWGEQQRKTRNSFCIISLIVRLIWPILSHFYSKYDINSSLDFSVWSVLVFEGGQSFSQVFLCVWEQIQSVSGCLSSQLCRNTTAATSFCICWAKISCVIQAPLHCLTCTHTKHTHSHTLHTHLFVIHLSWQFPNMVKQSVYQQFFAVNK